LIYCQACLTANPDDFETCVKCGSKLLVLGGDQRWEEPELPRLSMDDHFLERISNLEETVNHILEHLARLADSMETLDRNSFVTRSGLASLVETLKETRLLREDLLYQRWEATMVEQMEEARVRDRFAQMKARFLALYRGPSTKKKSFQNLIEEAEFQLFADRFDESVKTLERAFRIDQENYELAYYLAERFQEQGLAQEAAACLEKALKANSDHAESLLMLSLIRHGEEKTDEAEELLIHLLGLEPNHGGALLTLGALLTEQGRKEEARPLLLRAVDVDPRAQTYYLLGVNAKESGMLKEAIAALRQAVDLDDEHEDAVFALAMAYLERGWVRKAESCFARALELNPDKLEHFEAVQLESPEADAPELDGDSQETLEFAESLFREGKLKQALPHYRQLLKKHPGNPSLLSGYTVLNFCLRRYEETLKAAEKLLAPTMPDKVRCVAYTLQMESLRALGRYDEAVEAASQMLRDFPKGHGRVIANYGMAVTKADMGRDLNQAEKLAEEAVSQSPPEFRHKALDALGWVYFKQGRYEEALDLLKSALAMHENVNHLYHYGMVLLALNLKEEAFKVFERTVKLRGKTASVDDFLFAAMQEDTNSAEASESL